MATKAQINANRANAKKSTGPITSAGKAVSSRNRFSHGLCAALQFTPGESPEDLSDLFADFYDEYQPATATEQVLVERMVLSQWNFLRAFRYQTDAFTAKPDQPASIPFHLLLRYQQTADRGFFQAQKALLAARKERHLDKIGFESQTPVEAVEPEPAEPTPEPDRNENTAQPMPPVPKLVHTEPMPEENPDEMFEMDDWDEHLFSLMTPEEQEIIRNHMAEMKKRAKAA